jgi:hypothetical protein
LDEEDKMTAEDLRAELERESFIPLRLHLVSGKTIDVPHAGVAWMLRNSVVCLHPLDPDTDEPAAYDMIAIRNIERLEQLRRQSAAVT